MKFKQLIIHICGYCFQEAISEKDLAGAKGNLKAAIHMALEDQGNVLMELGTQVGTALLYSNERMEILFFLCEKAESDGKEFWNVWI